ncbi:hypothetical protein [Actinoplanes sp. NPDC023714]|uniref:hypothetical protein n=1 Tax=Actinoplanes sp. NPDC023714 TaxID=3154322 RepID=UPI0033F586DD
MVFLMTASMALLGGTTWLALESPVTRHPERTRRLAGIGVAACLSIAAIVVAVWLLTLWR